MKHQNVRETLITRAITVIAEKGLANTTTKAIVGDTGINEVYIYRQFSDKDDLLAHAFEVLDEELVECTLNNIPVMYQNDLPYEDRARRFFDTFWSFLMRNRNNCLAYVRYYYSPYYVQYSLKGHKERFLPVIEKFAPAFKDEADVWMILSHVLNIMLDFAVKAHNEEMPSEDNYEEHIFRVVYASIKQYFKNH